MANISTQDFVICIYNGNFDLTVSILLGTGVGLIVKYMLDKHYIFYFYARNIAHNTQTFALYTIMGLATTLIFWGFELSFHYLFEIKEMRYLGGIIGLTLGYLIKYHLDKRFVFKSVISP